MAQRKGGFQGTFNRCERAGCHVPAAKWSVYSQRMLCNACLSFERAAALAQEERKAAELERTIALEAYHAGLELDYADERETRAGLLQF